MRAALYLRVSSPEQAHDDRQSIPTQERVCVAVAEARGDEVVAVYRDDGATAYRDEIEHRPAFRRALAEAGARYDRLYVYMLDRFSRASLAAAGAWLQQLETGGAELVSASEWFDESPAGEFTRNLLLSQGRYFSRVLATRVKDALATKAAAGKWVGRRPYGYCKGTCGACVEPTGAACPRHGGPEQEIPAPGVIVPRPDEAAGYALLVKLVLAGTPTYRELARLLNAAGYRTARGRPWQGTSVQLVLTSPAYLGQIVLRAGAGPRTRAAYPGLHAPLLDRPTWERVQARCRELAAEPPGTYKAHYPYPLAGVLYCARCGARLVGLHTTRPAGDDRYYICAERARRGAPGCDLPLLRASACLDLVARHLDGLTLPPAWRDEVAAQLATPAPGPDPAALAAEEKRLVQLYQDGYLAYGDFKTRWDKVQVRRGQVPPPAEATLGLGALLERGLGTLFRQAGADPRAQRRLVQAVYTRLVVDGARALAPEIVEVLWQKAAEPLTRWFSSTSR